MGVPFCVLRVHKSKFLNYDALMSLKIGFILANSADPDEMLPYAAIHLGLHCLPQRTCLQVPRTKRVNKYTL